MALPLPRRVEMGAFYQVFRPMELSAGMRYTTAACTILIFLPTSKTALCNAIHTKKYFLRQNLPCFVKTHVTINVSFPPCAVEF
jgi:hypothetical protein